MKIWIGLLAVLLMAGGARAQGAEFLANVPLDDSAYEQVYELAWILGEPIIFGSSRDMTRYEFAIFVCRALDRIQRENNQRLGKGVGPIGPPQKPYIPHLRANPRAQLLLSRLIKKFSPDINAIINSNPEVRISGFEPGQIKFAARELAAGRVERILSDVASPFSDVASTHWAFEAVEYLRFSGIVEGYPKGKFNAQ